MAVAFTPNIGLAKPDETEIAKNWTAITDLHEDNKVIITNKMTLPASQSYAAVIIGPTTNPNVGTGSITAEYYEFEGWVFGNFTLKFADAGISSGSGTGGYGISLPFQVNSTFHTVGSGLNSTPGLFSVVGEGYFTDSSAVATSGTCAIDVVTITGVSYARLLPEAYVGKTARFIGPTTPVALANGDAFSGNFIYKKA